MVYNNHVQYKAHVEPVLPPPVFEGSWHQPWSTPLYPKIAPVLAVVLTVTGLFEPIVQPPNFISIDGHLPLAEPVRVKPEPVREGHRTYLAIAASMKWYQPLTLPTPPKTSLGVASQQALAIGLPPIIPPTPWLPPLSEPTKPKTSIYAASQQVLAFGQPPIIPQTPWFVPLVDPPKAKPKAISDYVFAPVTTVTAEVITVDKWFQPYADVTRKAGLATADQQALAFVKADPFPETVSEDRWHQPWSEPVRVKAGLGVADQPFIALPATTPAPPVNFGWFVPLGEPKQLKAVPRLAVNVVKWTASPATTAVNDAWLPPLAEPVRPKPFINEGHRTFAAVAANMKWFSPLSEPAKPRTSLATHSQQFLAYSESAQFPETVSEDRWHQPWSEPVRIKIGLGVASQPFLALPTFTPPPPAVVSLDWYLSLAAPVFVRPPLRVNGYGFAGVAPNLPWFIPLSDPVRFNIFAACQQQFLALPTTTPAAVVVPTWFFAPFTDPTRPIFDTKRLEDENPWAAVAASMKWFSPLTEPVKTRVFATSLQQFFAYSESAQFPESVTEDRWHQPWSEPIRVKQGLLAADQPAAVNPFVFTEVITVDKWFQWLNDPVRVKLGLAAADQSAFVYGAYNPIVPFSYFNWLADPVRLKLGLPATQQQYFAYGSYNPLVSFSYYNWLADPVRLKLGLPASAQQYFAYGTYNPIVASIGYYLPLAEPVRTKPGLLAAHQEFFKAGFKPIEPPLEWWQWLSDPVRIKLGLRPELQQFYTAPQRVIANVLTLTMSAFEIDTDTGLFAINVIPSATPVSARVSIHEVSTGNSPTSIQEH